MAKQTELELTAQQAAQPEETPAKKLPQKRLQRKTGSKKATTKKTTTKTKAAKAEDGESAAKNLPQSAPPKRPKQSPAPSW